jgi:hypothetical protein
MRQSRDRPFERFMHRRDLIGRKRGVRKVLHSRSQFQSTGAQVKLLERDRFRGTPGISIETAARAELVSARIQKLAGTLLIFRRFSDCDCRRKRQ